MHSRLAPLLRNEISKALRRRLPYFGLFAIGLLCGVVYFVAGQLSTAATANAWGYTAFSMQLVFNDLGPIFALVFPAMLLAEEKDSGAIRAALAAPVSRWELFLAKAITGLLYMIVLTVAALLFSMALAAVHFQFGAVGDSFGVVYARERMAREFLLGFLLSWIPLGALVMCGLFVSAIIRSPGAAVAVAISGLFFIEFTKHLVGLDPYIFTRYIEFSWLILVQAAQGVDYEWQPEVWKMIGLCGMSGLVAFGAGLIVFVRQDLNH